SRRADAIAEQRVGPVELAHDLLGVGVEQQLVVVEAMAAFGRIVAMNAIAINEARLRVGQIAVPDLVGPFRQFMPRDLTATRRVEDAEFDAFGMRREDGEINA